MKAVRAWFSLRGLTLGCLAMVSLLSMACEDGPGAGDSPSAVDQTEPAPPPLFRAPPIPNEIDGVVWEAGNWEPHLPAGDEGVSWGNHRAVVVIDAVPGAGPPNPDDQESTTRAQAGPTEAVLVTIPWRRRDAEPWTKSVVVVDASSGEPVANALALRTENESGDVVFQPNPGSSTYHVYYLPWQSTGGYYPTILYPTPDELREAVSTGRAIDRSPAESVSRAQADGPTALSWTGKGPDPDPTWEAAVRGAEPESFLRGRTTHIQSVNDFHSFFPMEVIATAAEASAIMAAAVSPLAPGWAVIPEHRDYPVRMRHFLPQHWTGTPTDTF